MPLVTETETISKQVARCDYKMPKGSICNKEVVGDPYTWSDQGGKWSGYFCRTHLAAFDANNAPFRVEPVNRTRATRPVTSGAKARSARSTAAMPATKAKTGSAPARARKRPTAGQGAAKAPRSRRAGKAPLVDLTNGAVPASREVQSHAARVAEDKAIRAWAPGAGYQVGTRGRIPAEMRDTYRASTGQLASA